MSVNIAKSVVAKLTVKFESDLKKFFVWAVEKEYVIKDIEGDELEWSLDLLKTINFKEPGRNKLEGFIAAVKDTYNIYRDETKVDDPKLLAKDFKEAPVEKKTKTTKKEKAESSDEAPKKVKAKKAKKESDEEEVEEPKPKKKAKAKKVVEESEEEEEVKPIKKATKAKAKKVVEESEEEEEEEVKPIKKATKAKAKKVVEEEEEEEDEKPKKARKAKAKKVVEDEEEEPKPVKKAAKAKAKKVVEDEEEEPKPVKKAAKAKKVIKEESDEEEEPKPKKATKAKKVVSDEEEVVVKVDMTLDTLDTEYVDTLEYWSADLVKAFGKPKKTGGDDEDHLYEWKVQVNDSIFSIYDWHNEEEFDDITWHISGFGDYEKNEKNLGLLTAYIDEFCSKDIDLKLDFENLGESDEEEADE
jgi:hypothetical protein